VRFFEGGEGYTGGGKYGEVEIEIHGRIVKGV
jgi:hypothetical protein